MQKTTSLIHKTVLKKDITRYAPVWAGYTIILLMILFNLLRTPAIMAEDMLDNLQPMGLINLFYGAICAMCLFMDLYKGRLCNAVHAFPICRETLLSTHILSGFLFSFVPNLLFTVLGCMMLEEYAYIALIWLAVCTLQFLFFYGTAILCAVCAGNPMGMGTLYGIFHFITFLITGVAQILYVPLLHGIEIKEDSFSLFFPSSQLSKFDYVDYEVNNRTTDPVGVLDPVGVFNGFLGSEWLYVGLCAVAGILCLLLAVYVYRKRNLENAGDLLSVKKLSPIYIVICTIGASIFMFGFGAMVSGVFGVPFGIFGFVLGFFAARMLLNRTLKVFSKKAFMWLGIFASVMIASFVLTALDPIGITRYVPKTDKIASAAIIGADKNTYYHKDLLFYTDTSFRITDKNELAEVQDFHRELIKYRTDESAKVTCNVHVVYKLTSGRTVNRYYKIANNSELAERAKAYASDIRYIFEVNDPQVLYTAFETVTLHTSKLEKDDLEIKVTDNEDIRGLIDAIAKDCEAGNMAQNWAYHSESEEDYFLTFSTDEKTKEENGWRFRSKQLTIYPESVNTVAYLKQMVDKYTPTDRPYIDGVALPESE